MLVFEVDLVFEVVFASFSVDGFSFGFVVLLLSIDFEAVVLLTVVSFEVVFLTVVLFLVHFFQLKMVFLIFSTE